MRFKRTKSNCKECPLRDRKRVSGMTDIDKPSIVVLGEAPGEIEDLEGKPFVGPAGRLLMGKCFEAGIMWKGVYRTNVICCRPPNNNITSSEALEAIECCRPGLLEELAAVKALGAKVVIPLGNTASVSVGIPSNISRTRGSVYQVQGYVAVPTYHPSFILRGAWKEEPTWVADLRKAKDISLKNYKPVKEKFNLFPTVADVEGFADEVVAKKQLIGVDIEGFHKILMIGLSKSAPDVLVVPFTKQGGGAYWNLKDEIRVKKAVDRILRNCPTIYQNAQFDVYALESQGYTVGNIEHDTMIMHHCLVGSTQIDTLDYGPMPIRELVGKSFWVVSHDGKKLVPKEARVCWSTGRHDDLVRVVFWSKSRNDKSNMWIDCTPDHEFPVQGKNYKVKACDLSPGDRLYPGVINPGRIGNKTIYRWVYEELTGPLGDLHVHHINGNHYDNRPDNLLAVTRSLHNQYHVSNRYKATETLVKRATAIRAQRVDVGEVLRLYFDVKLSYREVADYLNCPSQLVISVLKHSGRPLRTRSEALRERWLKAKNCRVIAVVPLKAEEETFDIEVPDTHNFSANGVIVGNSLNPELPHKLGYIVSIYGETPYWKDVVLQSDAQAEELDDTEFRTYNARDAAVLHQVLKPMLADLKELETESTYFNFGMKLLRPLMAMTRRGVLVNQAKLKTCQAKFKRSADKLEKGIFELLGLPENFNLDSPDQMRMLLHGKKPKSYPKAVEELKEYEINPKRNKNTKKYRELVEKVQLVESIVPLEKPETRVRRTDSGMESCDDAALLTIQRSALNRLEAMESLVRMQPRHLAERKGIERTLAFIELYRKYSEDHKLATTYSKYPIGPDGRIHANYKIHGTATGRLSSSEPNMQNQPEAVQDIFIVPDGMVMVKADYSNIEVRVMAYLSDEPVLIEALESGMNIHDLNTQIMFGITPDHPHWKTIRRAAKVFVFGRSYGGTVEGIYREVITKVPEVRLTLAKFKEADARYFEKLKHYAAWCEKQKKLARDTRTVTTAFGRKRFLLGTEDEIERQALNTPTQGTAGEIAEMAIIECYDKFQKTPAWDAHLIATVHDSILVECRKDRAMDVARAMKRIMEKTIEINGHTVSFPVDIEIGPSWGETEKVEVS